MFPDRIHIIWKHKNMRQLMWKFLFYTSSIQMLFCLIFYMFYL